MITNLSLCSVIMKSHQNVEVQGIERVRVLHGCASENGNGMESIYAPSFPSQLPLFDTHYNLCADISFALWHEVICSVRVLLTQGLCRMAQSQGAEFCSNMKMEKWKWNWLKEIIIASVTAATAIHNFINCKKCVLDHSGGCVHSQMKIISNGCLVIIACLEYMNVFPT